MVRAVDGMIKEKDAIFASLIVSVLLFQMETLAVGFLVMEQSAAIACAIILTIGTYYWYKYCSRIYHRFKVFACFFFPLSPHNMSFVIITAPRSTKCNSRGKSLKRDHPRRRKSCG